MLYALKRADGTVAITTLVPQSLVLSDGTSLEIAKVDGFGKTLFARDPKTDELIPVPFTVEFGDLNADSVPQYGKLVFPDIAAEIAKMPVPTDYVEWHPIAVADLPTDRYFRNAWSHDVDVKVHVLMDKAREIHKTNIREARAPLLAALDIAYQRADEVSDAATKKTVADKKKALRDAPDLASIAAASTPEELKAIWPAALSST